MKLLNLWININNMLTNIKSPRIVKINLYGLTMETLRLVLVHINYVSGNEYEDTRRNVI